MNNNDGLNTEMFKKVNKTPEERKEMTIEEIQDSFYQQYHVEITKEEAQLLYNNPNYNTARAIIGNHELSKTIELKKISDLKNKRVNNKGGKKATIFKKTAGKLLVLFAIISSPFIIDAYNKYQESKEYNEPIHVVFDGDYYFENDGSKIYQINDKSVEKYISSYIYANLNISDKQLLELLSDQEKLELYFKKGQVLGNIQTKDEKEKLEEKIDTKEERIERLESAIKRTNTFIEYYGVGNQYTIDKNGNIIIEVDQNKINFNSEGMQVVKDDNGNVVTIILPALSEEQSSITK